MAALVAAVVAAAALVPVAAYFLGVAGGVVAALAAILLGVLHAAAAGPDPRDPAAPAPTDPALLAPPPPSDQEPAGHAPPPWATPMRVELPPPPPRTWHEPIAWPGGWAPWFAWLLVGGLLVGSVAAIAGTAEVRSLARSAIESSWTGYVESCTSGSLESEEELCEWVLAQRDEQVDGVSDNPWVVLVAVTSLLVAGAALLAHVLATALRGARAGATRRRLPGLREFEVHWATAYVVGVALLALVAADGVGGSTGTTIRVAAAFVAAAGLLPVLLQGVSVLAWVLARPTTPRWHRVAVVVGALLFLAGALSMLLLLGILDTWLRIRRRASGSLDGRGSGG